MAQCIGEWRLDLMDFSGSIGAQLLFTVGLVAQLRANGSLRKRGMAEWLMEQ